MGQLKAIDTTVVKQIGYDLLSPEIVAGEYIEEIGAGCSNPSGYTKGSIFLARYQGVMHLYKALDAIVVTDPLSLDINCEYSSLNSEIGSVKTALSNEVTTRAKLGAHNLLRFDKNYVKSGETTGTWTGDKYTISGGDIYLYDDGHIVVDGTFTGSGTLEFHYTYRSANRNSYVGLADGSYRLCGGVNDNIKIIAVTTRNGSLYQYAQDKGTHPIFEVLSGDGDIGLSIGIIKGNTYDNVKVYPMIIEASDPSTDYTPYAMTNRELTEKVVKLTSQMLTDTEYETGEYFKGRKVYAYNWLVYNITTGAQELTLPTAISSSIYDGVDCKVLGNNTSGRFMYENDITLMFPKYDDVTKLQISASAYTHGSVIFCLKYTKQ